MRDALETAFLRQMEDDPDDDETALVYADLLEDKGQLTRAELVRAQIAEEALFRQDAYLALRDRTRTRVGNYLYQCTSSTRELDRVGHCRRALRALAVRRGNGAIIERTRTAENAQREELRKAGFAPNRHIFFRRRGVCEAAIVLSETFEKRGEAMLQVEPSVRFLILRTDGTRCNIRRVLNNPAMRDIQHLKFRERCLPPSGAKAIATHPNARHLLSLDLSRQQWGGYREPRISRRQISTLKYGNLESLEELRLRHRLATDQIEELLESTALPALRLLEAADRNAQGTVMEEALTGDRVTRVIFNPGLPLR